MTELEPSYLRYIYDGLEKGDLHPDNAASLPDGLIGLYEEAFEENKPAAERQILLNTFVVWALLKKEVSAESVAEILGLPTQEIIDFIAIYSSWFTSPESGKYQLYHERLKVYILQKATDRIIIKINKSILHLIKTNKEFSNYANSNEFHHYFLESFSNDEAYLEFINLLFNKIEIEKNNLFYLSKVKEGLKFGAISAGYHRDYNSLEKLAIKADSIFNNILDIKEDFHHLDKNIDYILGQLDRLILDESKYIYLLALITIACENILKLNLAEIHNLEIILKKLQALNIDEEFLITDLHANYLETKLSMRGINNETFCSNEFNGVPLRIGGGTLGLVNCNKKGELVYFDIFEEEYSDFLKHIRNSINSSIKTNIILNDNSKGSIIKKWTKLLEAPNKLNLKELLILIQESKDILLKSESVDDILNFDDIVYDCICVIAIEDTSFLASNLTDLFSTGHDYWIPNILYLKCISCIYHKKDLTPYLEEFYNFESNNELKMEFGIHISSFYHCTNNENKMVDAYLEMVKNSNSFSKKYNIIELAYQASLINPSKLVIEKLKPYFKHNSIQTKDNLLNQLSFVYSSEMHFLDLISFLNYDEVELSDVQVNYNWTFNITKSIIERMGVKFGLDYFLSGLNDYVKVMGKYSHEDCQNYNINTENSWKIEWFVITNFVIAFFKNTSSKIDPIILRDKINEIFENNNCDPTNNLHVAMAEYRDYRKIYGGNIKSLEYQFFNNYNETMLQLSKHLESPEKINGLYNCIKFL
jgi:hypothetical protein